MNDVKKTKKIDIHAHISPSGESMLTTAQQLWFYDQLNIEKGVLLPLVSPEFQLDHITSLDCKYIADQNPDRFLWFCGIDPRSEGNSPTEDLSKLIMHYKNLGAKGVGELTAQLYADDPLIDNLFYHCGECDMPVTIHLCPSFGNSYGLVDEINLPRIEKMLKKHKKLKIFGHSANFWSHISGTVTLDDWSGYPKGKVTDGTLSRLLREYENLYCDLSANSGANALMRDPEYAAKFIEEFSDRLMFGCDICSTSQMHSFKFSEFLDKLYDDGMISADSYYNIARGTAERLLNLK